MSGWSAIGVIAQFTLREALRNRILWMACIFAAIGFGLATFIGDVAIIEHQQVEVSFLAAAYRLCAVLAVLILVISTVVREFNDKCLELYLSLTISRPMYFLGKMTGFVAAGAIMAAVFGAALLIYAEPQAVALWTLSLVCELVIIAAIGIFCALTFNQQIPPAFAAGLFFYVLCRAADAIVLISRANIIWDTPGILYMRAIMENVAAVLPSLSRFTRTDWLAYNDYVIIEILPHLLMQTIIYTALISALALFDFSRKNI